MLAGHLAGHMAAPPRVQNMDHYIGAEVLHPVMVVHCARCYIFSQPVKETLWKKKDSRSKTT